MKRYACLLTIILSLASIGASAGPQSSTVTTFGDLHDHYIFAGGVMAVSCSVDTVVVVLNTAINTIPGVSALSIPLSNSISDDKVLKKGPVYFGVAAVIGDAIVAIYNIVRYGDVVKPNSDQASAEKLKNAFRLVRQSYSPSVNVATALYNENALCIKSEEAFMDAFHGLGSGFNRWSKMR